MRVGAGNHTELEGVGSNLGFDLESVLQCLTNIFRIDHPWFFGNHIEVAFVPDLKIRKLIIWIKRRVLFTCTFVLGYLIKWLPFCPALCPCFSQSIALKCFE